MVILFSFSEIKKQKTKLLCNYNHHHHHHYNNNNHDDDYRQKKHDRVFVCCIFFSDWISLWINFHKEKKILFAMIMANTYTERMSITFFFWKFPKNSFFSFFFVFAIIIHKYYKCLKNPFSSTFPHSLFFLINERFVFIFEFCFLFFFVWIFLFFFNLITRRRRQV